MTTVTLWLLIVAGAKNDAPRVVERFSSVAECERVRQLLPVMYVRAAARCIQATVVK